MSRFHLLKGRYSAPQHTRYSIFVKERMINGKISLVIDSHNKELPKCMGHMVR